jgi:hypothetical protein
MIEAQNHGIVADDAGETHAVVLTLLAELAGDHV